MTTAASHGPPGAVKCVVWDIDNTLLSGVYLEAGERLPGADPVLAGVLADLGERGILHAIASKNPPEAAEHTQAVTGWEFAAAECGWGRKSAALTRIAAGLGIGVDALAFVDDDPYERAEVSSALPEVLVLSPEEAARAPGWPEFSPPVITAEARRRSRAYAERRRRQQAERAFGGSRQEFLASVGTEVTIAPAAGADAPRLHELSVRTRRFNSAAQEVPPERFRSLIEAAGTDVVTVRLRDAFGDDGLVGACVIEHGAAGQAGQDGAGQAGQAGAGDKGAPVWRAVLVMMSCRAMGRGVIDALLAWLTRAAAREHAAGLEVWCVLSLRNTPLRLALAGAGFRATGEAATGEAATGEGATGERVVFRRDLDGPVPTLPRWVSAPGETGPVQS